MRPRAAAPPSPGRHTSIISGSAAAAAAGSAGVGRTVDHRRRDLGRACRVGSAVTARHRRRLRPVLRSEPAQSQPPEPTALRPLRLGFGRRQRSARLQCRPRPRRPRSSCASTAAAVSSADRRDLGLRRDGFNRRRLDRLRRFRPLLHAVAERAQDRGEILARAPVSDVMRTVTVKPPPSNAPGGFCAGDAFAPGERRADQIGEPLENIDAHRALAADPIAGDAIERLRRCPCRPGSRCGRWPQDAADRRGPCVCGPSCFSAQSCAASARGAGFSRGGR